MTQRHSVTRWFGALGLILALVGLVSQGTTSAQTLLAETRQSADQGDAAAPGRTVPNLVAEVAPATVSITGETTDGDETTGSGFLIDASGTLVTNLHVVEGVSRVTIRLPNGDSFERVVVRAYDEAKDIAILQVPGFSLPVVRLGNSDTVRQGDSVLLMGNPLGLTGTVSSGLISAVRQFDGYRVFQTDAAASPGNSGGPMLNEAGEVVGILTFRIEGGENLNFVVPINYARGLLQVDDSLSLAEMNSRLVGSRPVESSTASAPPRDPNAETTVMLSGVRGGTFEGVCRAITSSGAESRSLAGTLPAAFTFRADSLECSFTKSWGGYSTLLVQFVRDGRSLKHALTSAPYGSVSLTIDPTP